MADETDTNKLAFDKLKALLAADTNLSERVKNALAADLAGDDPKVSELKAIFEARNADAQ
jgi:hypothetical protein